MAKIGSKRASAWMSSGASGALKAGLGKWRGRSGRNAWRVRKIRSKMEAKIPMFHFTTVSRGWSGVFLDPLCRCCCYCFSFGTRCCCCFYCWYFLVGVAYFSYLISMTLLIDCIYAFIQKAWTAPPLRLGPWAAPAPGTGRWPTGRRPSTAAGQTGHSRFGKQHVFIILNFEEIVCFTP